MRVAESANITLTCSKSECAFRCSWTSPAGSRAGEVCSSPLNFQSDRTGEHRLFVAAVDKFGTRDLSPAEIVFHVVSDVVCVSESCGTPPPQESPVDSPPSDPAPVISLSGDDSVPPDTQLTATPPRVTRADTATFEFAASEPVAAFACGLGLGAPFACTSPFALIGLKEGGHAFRVFAVDAAGNRDASPALYEWLVDRTPPKPGQVAATGPGESSYLRSTSILFMAWTGFSDEPAGIQSFDTQVNTQSDCTGAIQAAGDAGLAHAVEPAGLQLQDGKTYFGCVRATDRAGNAGSWVFSPGLTVDVSEPTSTILQPKSGSKLPALSAIGGTAADTISGVAGVGLTIRRETDGLYWEGTSWGSEPSWNKATGESNFVFTGVPTWESGVRYVIRSRAIDVAGNLETRDSISLFTFDSTPPAFAGAASAISAANAVRVSWSTATDAVSPPLAIRYLICRSVTAGVCASFNATAVTAPGVTKFDFTGLSGNTTYYFVVRTRDEAGNTDSNLTEVSATTGNAN
ncbi:MAG: fibronectin type III domain-containing protein [Nitrospirae bacterium]|nr:fibronectin type III domain-containing protein [Nitrospirota bacterium]